MGKYIFCFFQITSLYVCTISVSYMDIPTYAKFLLITDYIPGAILDVQY